MIDHEKEWRLKAASAMEEIAKRLREGDQGCIVQAVTFVHLNRVCEAPVTVEAIVTGVDHNWFDFKVSVPVDDEDGETKRGEIG